VDPLVCVSIPPRRSPAWPMPVWAYSAARAAWISGSVSPPSTIAANRLVTCTSPPVTALPSVTFPLAASWIKPPPDETIVPSAIVIAPAPAPPVWSASAVTWTEPPVLDRSPAASKVMLVPASKTTVSAAVIGCCIQIVPPLFTSTVVAEVTVPWKVTLVVASRISNRWTSKPWYDWTFASRTSRVPPSLSAPDNVRSPCEPAFSVRS